MNVHQAVLIFEIVFALLTILYAITKKPARLDPMSGKLVLEYHPALRIFGLISCVGMTLVLIVLVIKFPFQKPEEPYYVAGMFLFFFLLGIYMLLESKCRVELDEKGISAWSPWTGSKAFSWADVAEVQFQASSSYFIVSSVSGQKIRINAILMRGVKAFCQIVQGLVSPEKLTRAQLGFNALNR
jgi:hypothetical protein